MAIKTERTQSDVLVAVLKSLIAWLCARSQRQRKNIASL